MSPTTLVPCCPSELVVLGRPFGVRELAPALQARQLAGDVVEADERPEPFIAGPQD